MLDSFKTYGAPPDTDVLAVEFKINLLAPARGDEFLACGRVLRAGRTLTVCLAEVLAIAGAERTPIATMLSTVIVRPNSRGHLTRLLNTVNNCTMSNSPGRRHG